MDRKTLLWTVTVFVGCFVLFQAIDNATLADSKELAVAIKAGAALLIVAVIVVVQRRKPK